jgi:D-alanyl-lipoteichoic acid acyltransferase DltB (MBOAT superfamily)
LVVFGEREKLAPERPPLLKELAVVLLLGCLIAGTVTAVFVADRSTALQGSFPLDHAIKLALFVVTIEAFSRMSWGLERLAGYGTTPIIDHCYLATTPGDFWRRYNRRVGQWLYLNVFRPSGGRRAPVRGVFLTFFVSAVFHEVCFAIATSRFTGCQFAFFFLQAPAVAMSNRLQAAVDRAGPGLRAISRGITVAWFYVTSVLFFEGVDRIFPFVYASRPSWLP